MLLLEKLGKPIIVSAVSLGVLLGSTMNVFGNEPSIIDNLRGWSNEIPDTLGAYAPYKECMNGGEFQRELEKELNEIRKSNPEEGGTFELIHLIEVPYQSNEDNRVRVLYSENRSTGIYRKISENILTLHGLCARVNEQSWGAGGEFDFRLKDGLEQISLFKIIRYAHNPKEIYPPTGELPLPPERDFDSYKFTEFMSEIRSMGFNLTDLINESHFENYDLPPRMNLPSNASILDYTTNNESIATFLASVNISEEGTIQKVSFYNTLYFDWSQGSGKIGYYIRLAESKIREIKFNPAEKEGELVPSTYTLEIRL